MRTETRTLGFTSMLLILICVFLTGSAFAQTAQDPQVITAYQSEMLRIEKVKAIGTIIAIVVPLLVGATTLVFGLITLKSQSKTAFEIKAAELIMQSPTPWVAEKRVDVLSQIFPERLKGLKQSFKPEEFPGIRLHEMKMELIRVLAEQPNQRESIKDDWKKEFPKDVQKFGILS